MDERRKRLTAADTSGAYLAPDRVIFGAGRVVARRFDAARRNGPGDPVALAASVGSDFYRGAFSASSTGLLAHRAGSGAQERMTWFDRTGKLLGHPGDVDMNGPELSLDDRHVAFDRIVQGNRDVWLMDLLARRTDALHLRCRGRRLSRLVAGWLAGCL